jgi:hypothetical protein
MGDSYCTITHLLHKARDVDRKDPVMSKPFGVTLMKKVNEVALQAGASATSTTTNMHNGKDGDQD